jgi:hypothetical protein
LERSRQRRDVASFDAVMSFFERHGSERHGSERYGGSVTGAPSNPDPYELRHIRF